MAERNELDRLKRENPALLVPVFEILNQRGFTEVLVNARDAKHVTRRSQREPSQG
jgi:hypothetical protein